MNIEALKFPIGRFKEPANYTSEIINGWIDEIDRFPENLRHELKGISLNQLLWKYRPGGWNIKQVVHHCVDSHMNGMIRLKFALTEEKPTIVPYDQDAWISLPDANIDDVSDSLKILEGLHSKWAYIARQLSEEQLNRPLIHPEHDDVLTVKHFIGLYAWHSNHHLGHIKQALRHEGGFN